MNKLQNKRLTKLGNHLLNGGDHLGEWNYEYFAEVTDALRDMEEGDFFIDRLLKARTKLAKGLSNGMKSANGRALTPIPKKALCGTVGCALGECSVLFPKKFGIAYFIDAVGDPQIDLFIYDRQNNNWHKVKIHHSSLLSDFFGLDDDAYDLLFMPTREVGKIGEIVYSEDGKEPVIHLGIRSSMKAVGQNILNYINIHES